MRALAVHCSVASQPMATSLLVSRHAGAAGAARPADVLECKLCGGRRTEAEFLAELQAAE